MSNYSGHLARRSLKVLGRLEGINYEEILARHLRSKSEDGPKVSLMELSNAMAHMSRMRGMTQRAIAKRFEEPVSWVGPLMKLQSLDWEAQSFVDSSRPLEDRLVLYDALMIIRASPPGTHLERVKRVIRQRKASRKPDRLRIKA